MKIKELEVSKSTIIHVEDATLARLEALRKTMGYNKQHPCYDKVIQRLMRFYEREYDAE